MFSSRLSSVSLTKYLGCTSTHLTPTVGTIPFYKDRLYNVDIAKEPTAKTTPVVVRQPFSTRGMTATVSTLARPQVRFAHTDMSFPDFTPCRNAASSDPTEAVDNNHAKRAYSYALLTGGLAGGAYGAKSALTHVAAYVNPAKDVVALAKIEVDLSSIPVGKAIVVKWRGKPLFVRHRSSREISAEQAVNLGSLRDPQTDEQRVKIPQWLILIGVCTHLGCVPLSHAGDFNGYYCPCHGSHYDASGRIRKGPAPLNLEVPPYEIADDLLVVG